MSNKRNLNSLNTDSDDVDFQVDQMVNQYWQSGSEKENEEPQSETQRSKRSRKQTDRFGLADIEPNDDTLFDQIDDQTSSNEIDEQTSSNELLSVEQLDTQQDRTYLSSLHLSSGEQILLKKLVEISTDVKVLQKSLVEMEIKLANMKAETHNLNPTDEALLLEIGLPLNNEQDIIEFDQKLKSKPFWLIVVIIYDNSSIYNSFQIKLHFFFFYLVQCTEGCWRRNR